MDSDTSSQIEQIDACCQVGRAHALVGYLCSPSLIASMRSVLLFESLSAPAKSEDVLAVVPVTAD
jgi:hypothetical protein